MRAAAAASKVARLHDQWGDLANTSAGLLSTARTIFCGKLTTHGTELAVEGGPCMHICNCICFERTAVGHSE